jgi:hypothetical protein
MGLLFITSKDYVPFSYQIIMSYVVHVVIIEL